MVRALLFIPRDITNAIIPKTEESMPIPKFRLNTHTNIIIRMPIALNRMAYALSLFTIRF
jgi:polysaccharide deacetylase 2 family uncharacterized protein YibQ